MSVVGLNGLLSPIIIGASGNTSIDCRNDPSPFIVITLNASSAITLTGLIPGCQGTVVVRSLSDRSFSLQFSDNPICFQKGGDTVIYFAYDGTKVRTITNTRGNSYSIPTQNIVYTATTPLYYLYMRNGEIVSCFLSGLVSAVNSNSNYWEVSFTASAGGQPTYTIDTKNWANANTRSFQSIALAPRLFANGGGISYRFTKVGNPGNLTVHSLSFDIYE
jgi:hypothetical protein